MSRRAAAGGLGLGVGAGFNISTVGPAADTLAHEYGVRLGVIGFLTTALFVHPSRRAAPGRAAHGPVRGRAGWDSSGLSVVICGNALALTASSLGVGIGGRLVTGIGTGVGFVAGSSYVRATWGTPTAQRSCRWVERRARRGLAIALDAADQRDGVAPRTWPGWSWPPSSWPSSGPHRPTARVGGCPGNPLRDAPRPPSLSPGRDPHGVVRVQRHPRPLDGLALRARRLAQPRSAAASARSRSSAGSSRGRSAGRMMERWPRRTRSTSS